MFHCKLQTVWFWCWFGSRFRSGNIYNSGKDGASFMNFAGSASLAESCALQVLMVSFFYIHVCSFRLHYWSIPHPLSEIGGISHSSPHFLACKSRRLHALRWRRVRVRVRVNFVIILGWPEYTRCFIKKRPPT